MYFSKMSEVFLEIFQHLSRNCLKLFSKFFDIILRIFIENFRIISGNYFSKYFSKVSEVFLGISDIFTKILKLFSKFSAIILRIFRNISQNVTKYFSKFSAKIIEIFVNFFENFQNNLQNFGNVSKLSEIIFKIFRNDLIPKIFLNTGTCTKYFSKSSDFLK